MNVVIIARTQEEADNLAYALTASGRVVVLDALGGTEDLAAALRWRPDVLVVHRIFAEEVRDAKPGKPILVYEDRSTPDEIVQALLSPPSPPSPPQAPPRLPSRSVLPVLGFQGAYGGAGTTTVVCAIALAAARSGRRPLVLDVLEDCAVTLDPFAGENTQTFSGVTVLTRVPEQPQIEHLVTAYDLVLVDAGTVRERSGLVRFLIRQFGAVFYLVLNARRQTELPVPPGYGVILNCVSGGAPWWQKSDAQFPFVSGLTARVNAGKFGESSPLFLAAEMFLEKVIWH